MRTRSWEVSGQFSESLAYKEPSELGGGEGNADVRGTCLSSPKGRARSALWGSRDLI